MAERSTNNSEQKPFLHEFEERKRIQEEVPYAKAVLDALIPIPGLEQIYKYGRLAEMELRHATTSQDKINAGRGKNFQETFERVYRDIDFPTTQTPSKTGVFIFEDTPKEVTPEKPFVHGHGVTAYSQAAADAMGGNPITAQLISRLPLADDLGQHWTETKRTPTGGLSRQSSFDLAQFFIRNNFKLNDANVVSVSLVTNDPTLNSPEERQAENKKITEYFSKNTIFVVASGNEETQNNPALKHNSLRHHPNTIVVGAANVWDTIGANGVTNNSYSLAHYSTPGPDIVMAATPNEALYASTTSNGVRFMPQRGTSLATPQAAAGIAKLLQRFVASPKNPQAVLSAQDVLLATKNTANPLHTIIHDKVGYNTLADPAIETRTGRTNKGLAVFQVNNNYVSLQAGNGVFDPAAAWELLEKQELEVREGREKIMPRQNVTVESKPTLHTIEPTAGRKKLPQDVPAQTYRYTVEVADDLKSDQLNMELTSKEMSRKLVKNPIENRPRIFLINPKGGTVEVGPSANITEFTDTLTGNKREEDNDYVLGHVTGMQGSDMKGTWTLLSTERLDNIRLNFEHAMSPEHVAARIIPDSAQRTKQLFKAADMSAYSLNILDTLMKPDSFLLKYDISQTGFPSGYTELKLAQFAQSNQEAAKKLLDARYHSHPYNEELTAAIDTRNARNVVEALIPENKRYDFIKDMAKTGKKEDLIFLVNNGFADLKDPNAPQGTKPSTALIQVVGRRADKMEVDLLEAFLNQGVDPHYQDEKGRSVLHYATNSAIQSKLINIDLNGPNGARMIDLKDKDGKVYHEIPWNDRLITMGNHKEQINIMYADNSSQIEVPSTPQHAQPVKAATAAK